MKKISIHVLVTFFMLTSYYDAFSQCTSCSLNGPTKIDVDQTRTFSTSTLSGSNYFWSTTGGLTIIGSNTSSSVSVKGTNAGSGKVCVTRYKSGTQPCCYCKTVSIIPPCRVPSVSIAQEPFGCQGDILTFNAVTNPVNASGTFNWSIPSGVGTIVGSNTNQTLNVQSSTSFGFSISLTFTSTCNNTQVNAFTLAQFLDCGFFISPNPSNDLLLIQTSENSKIKTPYSVEVIDQNGKVRLKVATSEKNKQIDISNLPNDLYYVRVITNGKVVKTTKLIKK